MTTPLTGSVMLANVLVKPSLVDRRHLTDDHTHPLTWLAAHPTGSLAAAQALDLAITDPDHSGSRSGRSLLNGPFAGSPPFR